MEDSPSLGRRLQALWLRLWNSWATRSLAVGGVATLLDIAVLLVGVEGLAWPNPVAAMVGVLVGAVFTFFANRAFAFRDHAPQLAPQALRFGVATGAGMLVHAGFVYLLADRMGVPVVLAKLGADVCVFTVGQLLVLRFFVFPKARPEAEAQDVSGEVLSVRAAERTGPARPPPPLEGVASAATAGAPRAPSPRSA